jgi:hypothetical protein
LLREVPLRDTLGPVTFVEGMEEAGLVIRPEPDPTPSAPVRPAAATGP